MEKKPIFGRLILVAIIGVWTFLEWYPPQGDNMVDAFKLRASKEADTAALFDRLDKANAELQPGTELTLNAWMDAIGKSTDLRSIFPDLLFPENNNAAKERVLEELKINTNAWTSPSPAEQFTINRALLAKIQKDASGKVKLGLDLRGGTQFVVQVKPKEDPDNPGEFETVTAGQLTQAMEIMRRRVDTFGVSEPLIQTSGDDKIIIQIPGLGQEDRDKARKIISDVAQLDFRLSHPDSAALIRDNEQFVPGAERKSYVQKGKSGEQIVYEHFISKEVALEGSHIKSASARRNDLTGVPEIHFTLDAIGANKFAKVTERHRVGNGDERLLAIVLDDKLISAPSINGRIHARGQITGDFSIAEATMLANSLENPLENKVEIIEERDVDPSLGRDSIAKGYKAAIWGLAAVAVFMLFYYLLTGVVANIALALNITILLGVLCWFDATLTLPGIAGIVLTIGMAVDANVLIYERIREELNVGKSLKGAIASGYDKAFGTIFDANITTMIASVILIFMGKGPVKGFGVTLTIGILASMFTALVVTRLVMDMLLQAGIIGDEKSKRLMHLRPNANLPKFDFLKYAKPAFIITWILIVGGITTAMFRGYSDTKTLSQEAFGKHQPFRSVAVSYNGKKAEGKFYITGELVEDGLKISGRFPHSDPDRKLIIEPTILKLLDKSLRSKDKPLIGSWGAIGILVDVIENDQMVVSINGEKSEYKLTLTYPTFWDNIFTNAKNNMLGVDFAGGYSMLMNIDAGSTSKLNDDIESGSFREQLSLATGIDGAQIQAQLQTEKDTREQKLRIDFPLGTGEADNASIIEDNVKRIYGEASLERIQLDKVGPSVSGEIQRSALIAVVLALFGILIYVAFRYEYSFAVGAVVAILHDVLMTGGWFFLMGRELNAPIVAAALTIIGFSINDTIVIFDRIRENLRVGTRGSFADVMNTALNQTLSRTIITSGTTLLSTATLYFFGGTVINDFAFTFLVGVITGTYSSIYIACAIVLWWHKGKRPELAAPMVDTDTVGAVAT